MIRGHGGNIHDLAQRLGCSFDEIIDMSSNVNPFGPPPGLFEVLSAHLADITALPQVDAEEMILAFSRHHGIDPETVIAGNGTTQFIYTIPLALETKKALIAGPTYSDYADACAMHGASVEFEIASPTRDFQPDLPGIAARLEKADTAFICNPNNPTGALIPKSELEALCRDHPAVRFIIDESYLPFAGKGESNSMIRCGLENVLTLNSMSKIFRIPGLRIGFIVASKENIETLGTYAMPWSVNALAQLAVRHLMDPTSQTDRFIRITRERLSAEKAALIRALKEIAGLRLFPSHTSFILMKLPEGFSAPRICDALCRDRILIRNCSNFYGLSDQYIRISLKTPSVNRMLTERLVQWMQQPPESI